MKQKGYYTLITICLLFLVGIFSYFLMDHISVHALGLFLFIIIGFYFFDGMTHAHFEKEHYVYVIIIALSILFFYYIQSQILYIDKLLHFAGGVMLCAVMFHYVKKSNFSRREIYFYVFIISLVVIVGYEAYEYFSDLFFNTHMQGVYFEEVLLIDAFTDTVQDVILGTSGAFLYLGFIFLFSDKN